MGEDDTPLKSGDAVDTDDEYDSELADAEQYYVANLGEHAKYLAEQLAIPLDLAILDNSLVLQAKISGRLNNECGNLKEKEQLVRERLDEVKSMYKFHFGANSNGISRVEQLKTDIANLEKRLSLLKNGSKGVFTKKLGVVEKFPIEYNQARDKVIERQLESSES